MRQVGMEMPSRTRGRPVGLGSGRYFDANRGPLASLPRPKCHVLTGWVRRGQCPLSQTVHFLRHSSVTIQILRAGGRAEEPRKGIGGRTTLVALGAVINAILDALAALGMAHIDRLPTPALWQAIQVRSDDVRSSLRGRVEAASARCVRRTCRVKAGQGI